MEYLKIPKLEKKRSKKFHQTLTVHNIGHIFHAIKNHQAYANEFYLLHYIPQEFYYSKRQSCPKKDSVSNREK